MSWSKARRRRHRVIKQIYLQAQVRKCAYCGRRLTYDTATYDHVVPRSRGGQNELANKVLVCETCNVEKSNRLPTLFQVAAVQRVAEIVRVLIINRFGNGYFMGMEARQKKNEHGHVSNIRLLRPLIITKTNGETLTIAFQKSRGQIRLFIPPGQGVSSIRRK